MKLFWKALPEIYFDWVLFGFYDIGQTFIVLLDFYVCVYVCMLRDIKQTRDSVQNVCFVCLCGNVPIFNYHKCFYIIWDYKIFPSFFLCFSMVMISFVILLNFYVFNVCDMMSTLNWTRTIMYYMCIRMIVWWHYILNKDTRPLEVSLKCYQLRALLRSRTNLKLVAFVDLISLFCCLCWKFYGFKFIISVQTNSKSFHVHLSNFLPLFFMVNVGHFDLCIEIMLIYAEG